MAKGEINPLKPKKTQPSRKKGLILMNITLFSYNGQTIGKRPDNYLNGSQMCFANGKLLADWKRLKVTTAYVQELSVAMGIPIGELLECKNGVETWVHPSLAINLARWISPKFAVWCDAHIFNLMTTGQTSLDIDPLEEMRLKLALANAEKENALAQQKLLDTRYMITQTCPEPVQQKILGYQTVEIPVIEKVVYREDEFIRDNSTLNKTQLCHRYGILTRNGKPDYPRLNKLMATLNLPKDAWREIKNIQPTEEFNKDYLTLLDRLMIDDSRQLWIAEAS
jgi:hypothetical protein